MPKIKSKKKFNLFFMNPVSYGGHVSFTVHLMRGLRANGHEVKLFKVGKNTEKKERKFGYEEFYRNLCLEDALQIAKNENCLITAPSKPKSAQIDQMLDNGSRIVIHDPAEFKHGWDYKKVENPIVIRESMIQYFEDAAFLKHPYDPLFKEFEKPTGEWAAVSTSRIDFDKHTEILLDANRLLKEKNKIHIYGFENRLYTKFKIMPHYPEWEQSKVAYPKTLRYAVEELLHKSTFMCDMSIIKGDGGGTQYTFLEAIDAGCCCVVHDEWIINGHAMEPGVNCLSVSEGKELAKIIKKKKKSSKITQIAKNARELMENHNAKKVTKSWAKEMNQ